jgi:multidrug efflux pump
VLVGGMSIGTFFTLLVVPSVYVLIARDRSRQPVAEHEPDLVSPNAETAFVA